MSKEEKKSNDDIAKRLDTIIAVLLNQDKLTGKTQREQITFLTKCSFSNPEIARILNTSLGTIEATKYAKKDKKASKGKIAESFDA